MEIFRIHRTGGGHTKRYLPFLLCAALLLSSCLGKVRLGTVKMVSYEMVVAEQAKRQEVEQENQRLRDALEKKTTAYRELERKIATAQLQIVKREIQNRDPARGEDLLRKRLDGAIRDVVRAKAKLRSLESKAEAASSLAEAEIALNTLRSAEPNHAKGPEIVQTEQLLKMSALEFKNQNYSGALYLTSQAKGLIKMAKERSVIREKEPEEEVPVSFVLPVPLRVLRTSNLRAGPGLQFKVIHTLKKDSTVVAHSYKDQWVGVTTENGQEGWIFHALVDGR